MKASDAGADASGGAPHADGGSGGSGTGGNGGTGGTTATGGNRGTGGTDATGGTNATGGETGAGCAGLDYCSCAARPDCAVLSEACFCPCGEKCEPTCACVCGGGAYLGCTAASITAPGVLEGTWLVGWSGGLNHYSWVRFAADGSADVLDGAAIGTNAPYWPCNGRGSWVFAQKPETVFLTLPAGCTTATDVLTFTGFQAPQGFPKAAVLGAHLEAGAGTPTPLDAWKFPPTQCDAALETCTDPFGFPP
ncbi:MAG TPA: hypothetical protein VF395_02465 [Polyangiaceae bacterium]